MTTIPQNDDDRSQPNPDNLARALGDPITVLLDRKARLQAALHAIEYEIYCELANRLQAQIGVMAALFDDKLERRG